MGAHGAGVGRVGAIDGGTAAGVVAGGPGGADTKATRAQTALAAGAGAVCQDQRYGAGEKIIP